MKNSCLAAIVSTLAVFLGGWSLFAAESAVRPNVVFILCDDLRPDAVKDFENMVHAYWGTVLSVDDSVGRLVQLLESRGELENTLIIFMGDNGLLEGEHGMVDKRTLCRAPPIATTHGRSWKPLCNEGDPDWRTAWLYEYNYEKQFPYTPNIRGIRTDRFKFVHYPHGDGTADRHLPEMYDLVADPDERNNLAVDPAHAATRADLERRLADLLTSFGLTPEKDTMPLDAGITSDLPDQKVR